MEFDLFYVPVPLDVYFAVLNSVMREAILAVIFKGQYKIICGGFGHMEVLKTMKYNFL